MLTHLKCLLVVAALCMAAASPASELPVPDASAGFQLRVAILNGQRHPPISAEFSRQVLAAATRLVKHHFGVKVRLVVVANQPLESVARPADASESAWIGSQSLDPATASGMNELVESLRVNLPANGGSPASLASFARPYLAGASDEPPTPEGLARALAQTHAALNRRWRSESALDGQPLVLDDPSHQYAFWIAFGERSEWDLVLTNQPIVSTEKLVNSVHTAIRGGASLGHTGPARLTSTGTYSVVSAFPALSDDRVSVELRDLANPSRARRVDYVAAVVAHELGHQLLHLGHPFGNEACVMRPPVRFRFEEWLRKLNPTSCRVGMEPAMTPGVQLVFPDIRQRR